MQLFAIMTSGLAWLIVPFLYNKIYIKELLQKGFIPVDEFSKNHLKIKIKEK